MPVSTMASAVSRMSFSSTSQPNLFQVLKPMGGTGARRGPAAADGEDDDGPGPAGSLAVFSGPQAARMARTRTRAMGTAGVFFRLIDGGIGLSLDKMGR